MWAETGRFWDTERLVVYLLGGHVRSGENLWNGVVMVIFLRPCSDAGGKNGVIRAAFTASMASFSGGPIVVRKGGRVLCFCRWKEA